MMLIKPITIIVIIILKVIIMKMILVKIMIMTMIIMKFIDTHSLFEFREERRSNNDCTTIMII